MLMHPVIARSLSMSHIPLTALMSEKCRVVDFSGLGDKGRKTAVEVVEWPRG
jgi:hypothetical protein